MHDLVHLGRRIELSDAGRERLHGVPLGEVRLGDDDHVGEGRLLDRLRKRVELAEAVHRVDGGHDACAR